MNVVPEVTVPTPAPGGHTAIRSRFCIGDPVHCVFNARSDRPDYVRGYVRAVRFDDAKVSYDVGITIEDSATGLPRGSTVIRDVDSAFVLPPPPV